MTIFSFIILSIIVGYWLGKAWISLAKKEADLRKSKEIRYFKIG